MPSINWNVVGWEAKKTRTQFVVDVVKKSHGFMCVFVNMHAKFALKTHRMTI